MAYGNHLGVVTVVAALNIPGQQATVLLVRRGYERVLAVSAEAYADECCTETSEICCVRNVDTFEEGCVSLGTNGHTWPLCDSHNIETCLLILGCPDDRK